MPILLLTVLEQCLKVAMLIGERFRARRIQEKCLEGLYDLAPSHALRFSYREDDLIPFQEK